jgi:aromatic-L-amino-acid/L-tryptophan decarboxylase
VIQDTASTATLVAILTAREKATQFAINKDGFASAQPFRIYCSTETHSSVEKGAKIAGIGSDNVVKISTNESMAMRPELLEAAIEQDLADGKKPLCVVAALGTTGTTAIDPLPKIAQICQKYGIWLHIDAAYAGSLLLLPEYRWMIEGIELADSFVFNPHKWLLTHFDCTAYFVKDKELLVNTFDILPEYLRTKTTNVNNYKDWGIQLGRRFRALKLWFVIRTYGIEGLQNMLRGHNQLAIWLEEKIIEHPHFELLAPRSMNLVCFHYLPENTSDMETINQVNEQLLHQLNHTGKLYLTHTKIRGQYTLRMVIGQAYVEQRHVENAWEMIKNIAGKLPK